MEENLLIAACLASRTAYEDLKTLGIDGHLFTPAGKALLDCAAEQYERDTEQQSIDEDILSSQFARKYQYKQGKEYAEFYANLPEISSPVNIANEYALLRREHLGRTIASMLASGMHGAEVDKLIDEYKLSTQGSSNEPKYRLEFEDFREKRGQRLALHPNTLNDFIGGGVLRGHNVVIYGRPDSGKSLLALNLAAHFLQQGYKVLYVANEEPAQEITKRLVSRLARVPIGNLRNPDVLQEALDKIETEYLRWFLLHAAAPTITDVSKYASKVKPDVIIVDQIKNLSIKGDNRALQLDELARQVRALGIAHHAVTISVTQAGDSASNKLVLEQNDVEWSNTGIPGAADLMIGVGTRNDWEVKGQRMLSICKNKVNARKGHFGVWVRPEFTVMTSSAPPTPQESL